MLNMSDAYIAATTTVIPPSFASTFIADKYYPKHLCSERVNQLAKRGAASMGIKQRPTCLNFNRIPDKDLWDSSHHPLSWCSYSIKQLSQVIPIEEIGYVGIAYNCSFHKNTLPNLACQAILHAGISPEVPPEEFGNYGCAGGFFPLKAAVRYCRQNHKAAIVIVFDQCSCMATFNYDLKSPMFTNDLRVNLLFSDGAVAMLIVPERIKRRMNRVLPRIEDISTAFQPSDAIRFDDARFILGDQVKDEVPLLAAKAIIMPLLTKHGMRLDAIGEWSMHQGGSGVLSKFAEPDVLGLDKSQLARSLYFFEQFGNMSAPSAFLVFDSFYRESSACKAGQIGMIVAFGAGFYLGGLLYRWV